MLDNKQQSPTQLCLSFSVQNYQNKSFFIMFNSSKIQSFQSTMGQNQSKLNQNKSPILKPYRVNTTHSQIKTKRLQKQQTLQIQTNIDPHQIFSENYQPNMSQVGQDYQSYQIDNEQLQQFQDIGTYSGGDQRTSPSIQIRQEVASAYSKYPFNTIVRIISIFDEIPFEDPRNFPFGSGVIITPRMILTVAHNIWQENIKKTADYVFVQPQTQGEQKKLIRVIKIGVHKGYFNPNDSQRSTYDLAILILEQNDIIKPTMTMKLKNHYDLKTEIDRDIIIAGFPQDRNQVNSKRFEQYSCQIKIKSRKQNFIFYSNVTGSGQSGAPLILKFVNSQGYMEYTTIGLHKGFYLPKSYGILTTNDNKIQVAQIARNFSIMNPKVQQEIDDKKQQFIQFLKKIQILQKSKGQSDVQINNVVWKCPRIRGTQLNQFVFKNDKQSFRNAILKLRETFKMLLKLQQKNIVSEVVHKSFFDNSKIVQRVFGIKQQDEYFSIVEDYINYIFGIKQQVKQVYFYSKLGERLYTLQNKLCFKKDPNKIIKDRESTFCKMQHKFIERREKIIQNIKKGLSAPSNKSYDKKQRIFKELNFLLKLNDLKISQKYVNDLQQQDQTDKILLLKAEVLKLNGNIKRAKIFFENVRDSNQKDGQGKESFEYTKAIQKLGQIHRIRGDYEKCFEYFNQNMQLRKKMNPQEDTIEYAEALNYLASYEIDNMKHNEAAKKIKTALAIAQKVHGPNSIQLVKYLSNLSVVHYQKCQLSQSLRHSKRALQIIQDNKGSNSLETIQIINNIGAALRTLRNTKEALDYYLKALDIEEAHRGKQSYYCAPILNNIAHSHLNLGNLLQCETTVKKSIQIYEKFKTDHDSNNKVGCGLAYFNLACLYETKGKIKQAVQEAEKSFTILKAAKGASQKAVKNAQQLLVSCKKKLL